jgi:hypothetical protein
MNFNVLKIFRISCLNLDFVASSLLVKKAWKIWQNKAESISLSVLKASIFSIGYFQQYVWFWLFVLLENDFSYTFAFKKMKNRHYELMNIHNFSQKNRIKEKIWKT